MLSKRIFWLALAAAVGWLIWMRLRQRQDEFAATTPQFAAPRTFEPALQPAPTPQPASDQSASFERGGSPAIQPAPGPQAASEPEPAAAAEAPPSVVEAPPSVAPETPATPP